MPQLTLSFFGPPQIEIDGTPVEITRRKAVALLAYLAVTGQGHSRDALATMLWPEADQTRARAALRSALWALNKAPLQDWLVIEPEMVMLRRAGNPANAAADLGSAPKIDTVIFREMVSAARRYDPGPVEHCDEHSDESLEPLAKPVALYRNDFLAGFTLPDAPDFDDWQFFQANSLRQDLAWALETLVGRHRSRTDYDSAIAYARRYVALDPLHEPAQRLLMELYAQDGQQSAALRQYEVCRKTLESELGLEPSEETVALSARIRSGVLTPVAGDIAGDDDSVSPTRIPTPADNEPSQTASPHNLPPQSSPLIGREQELAGVAAFLEDETTRLLTIIGPGGIGKTRLALAAAAEQVSKPTFPDGIYFVSLASVTEPEIIVPAIAEEIGYHFQSDQRTTQQQLMNYLSRKSMLLVLDNLEQLLLGDSSDGTATITELLQHAPQVKVLTTSRERLNLYEEQRYPLLGLAVSEGGADDTDTAYAAASLFLQSARRRFPDFEITPTDSASLADLCHLVEGMPLALELAAAGLETHSLLEIAAEIQGNLDLLVTDVRNVPERHRSMLAVFDASWHALNETERRVYAHLSVFRNGFTQDAAKAIAGADRRTLGGLVSKSLLRFNHRLRRYEIHELLRQYAAEQLGENNESALDRHADFFAVFLQQREADLKGSRQREALAEIEADGENARSAWQWAVDQSRVALLESALNSLAIFYQWQGRLREGETFCRQAAEMLSTSLVNERGEIRTGSWTPDLANQARTLVQVLTWQGFFEITLAKYADAHRSLQRAQDLLDEPDLTAQKETTTFGFLLLQLSNLAVVDEYGGKAKALAEQALAVYQATGDAWGTAQALDALSQRYMNQGMHDKAFQLRKDCLSIRQQIDDWRGIARSYNLLGLLVIHTGQLERSERYLRKSLALYRTMDNPADLAIPLAALGINLLFGGRFEECIASYEESWAIHRELSLPQGPFLAEATTTRAQINLGRYREARAQAEADLARFRAIDHPWSIAFTLHNLGRIDLAEGASGSARKKLEESVEILKKMNERSFQPDVHFCLVYAERALGNRRQAIQSMVHALQLVIETGPLNPMRFELPAMALLLADHGEAERAVEFYAAAMQSPYIRNSRWFEDIAGRQITDLAATMPQAVVAVAQARGQERDLWQTANDLLAELSKANSEI